MEAHSMISKEARSVSVIATGLISIPFYSLFVDASGSDAVARRYSSASGVLRVDPPSLFALRRTVHLRHGFGAQVVVEGRDRASTGRAALSILCVNP